MGLGSSIEDVAWRPVICLCLSKLEFLLTRVHASLSRWFRDGDLYAPEHVQLYTAVCPAVAPFPVLLSPC